MQFLRMVKSELRRLFSDKKRLIIFFAVFALFIALITVYLCTLEMSGKAPEKVEDFGALSEKYRKDYEYYRAWYLFEIGEAPYPENLDYPFFGVNIKERMDFYEFMLTQTSWRYFVTVPHEINFYIDPPIYRGVDAAFWVVRFSFYPLVLFSVVSAVLNCISPYERGVMKNYSASPTDNRTIMGGKLFAVGLVDFLVWFIILVWGLSFGASNASVHVLFYVGGKYFSQPLLAVIFSAMLGTLIAMLFMCWFTVFVGQFIKKSLPSALVGVGFIVLSLALCCVVFSVNIAELVSYGYEKYTQYFSVIDLSGLFYNFSDWRLWVAFAFYLVIGAAMVVVIILLQTGREFNPCIRRTKKAEK